MTPMLITGAIVGIVLCGSACMTLLWDGPSKIATTEWDYLKVVYLVRDAEGLRAVSWSTRDRETLSRLRRSFPKAEESVSFNIGGSRVNRVDIGLRNRQWWVIAYHPHAKSMNIHDPYLPKRSFHYVPVGPEFYEAIKDAVKADTGADVDLGMEIGFDDIEALRGRGAGHFEYGVWE